jgi:hypothetical protein
MHTDASGQTRAEAFRKKYFGTGVFATVPAGSYPQAALKQRS